MTTCRVCSAPIDPPRRVYCSDDCEDEARREWGRWHYHNDPAYAAAKKEQSRRWHAAHPGYQRQQRRRRAFARVLGKARS